MPPPPITEDDLTRARENLRRAIENNLRPIEGAGPAAQAFRVSTALRDAPSRGTATVAAAPGIRMVIAQFDGPIPLESLDYVFEQSETAHAAAYPALRTPRPPTGDNVSEESVEEYDEAQDRAMHSGWARAHLMALDDARSTRHQPTEEPLQEHDELSTSELPVEEPLQEHGEPLTSDQPPEETLEEHDEPSINTTMTRSTPTETVAPSSTVIYPSVDGQLAEVEAHPTQESNFYPAPLNITPTRLIFQRRQNRNILADPHAASTEPFLTRTRIIEDQDDAIKQAILRNAYFLFESHAIHEINIAVGSTVGASSATAASSSSTVLDPSSVTSPSSGFFAFLYASVPQRVVTNGIPSTRRSTQVLMEGPRSCRTRRRALEGLLVRTERAVGEKVCGGAVGGAEEAQNAGEVAGEEQ
ncbi:hypothetical protein NA57DRAFT_61745 [Rhizodiscina lignyota]|uniref:Uncharacterized protein n=1 Tax=Rhizodiscina lignyota TaxID=1504668 RepID=A0A9P4I1G8_9PEZI|nr:hypothetical protein NA57DRAFT_61745 [Rhizodiscina lignyota]